MGNQYTKGNTVSADDPTTTIRFPSARLNLMKKAAKTEGQSFNAWLLAAGEERLATSAARLRAIQEARGGRQQRKRGDPSVHDDD